MLPIHVASDSHFKRLRDSMRDGESILERGLFLHFSVSPVAAGLLAESSVLMSPALEADPLEAHKGSSVGLCHGRPQIRHVLGFKIQEVEWSYTYRMYVM